MVPRLRTHKQSGLMVEGSFGYGGLVLDLVEDGGGDMKIFIINFPLLSFFGHPALLGVPPER